jgi:adenylate kinase family enzyme
MARLIAVMGESGSGKTTSMRNLDPKTTFYIDCDKKGLSWKGWKKQYSKENQNYVCSDDIDFVTSTVQMISNSDKFQHIKVVIVDTINALMVADEMKRMKEKGYDKWQDLAVSVYSLIDKALTFRDDLTVVFLAHTQTDREDSGYMFTHIKTSGKKLDKIVLESKFSTVLLCKNIDGEHKFETKANNSTAKVPMGAIDETLIDNDIVPVIKALEEF